MAQTNIIGNTVFSLGSPIEPYRPFRATGGIVETFVTGGISYTLHSFISGSGSFEILQGAANIEVLVVGGGGAGSQGLQRAPLNSTAAYTRGNGGGAGGYVFVSQYVKKSPQYVTSSFNAYVGNGGTFYSGAFATLATQSSFVQTFDQRGYYYNPPIITSSYGGGSGGGIDDSPNGNGASGGGGGGLAIYGGQGNAGGTDQGLAGGGGAGAAGANVSTYSGLGGAGITLPAYFGGPSGSYPIQIAGGGNGGGYYRIGYPPLGTDGAVIPAQTGSYGGGSGGSWQAGYNQPTLAELTGSNGVANTGGGGGGGGSIIDLPGAAQYYGPAGNGGSGVIRVAYQTQF